MLSATSLAIERLEGDQFQKACRAYESEMPQSGKSVESAICTAYLLGYLAAVDGFQKNPEAEKTYHERAMETRAKGLLYKDKRLKGKRYCIPGDDFTDTFITRINEVSLSSDKPGYAENVVEAVLDKHYRCPD